MLLQRKTKAAEVQSRSRPRTCSSGALGVIKLLLFSGVKLSSAIKQVQERSRTHTKVNCSIWWWEINSPWKQRGKIEHSVLLRSWWWLQWKVVKTSAKFYFLLDYYSRCRYTCFLKCCYLLLDGEQKLVYNGKYMRQIITLHYNVVVWIVPIQAKKNLLKFNYFATQSLTLNSGSLIELPHEMYL